MPLRADRGDYVEHLPAPLGVRAFGVVEIAVPLLVAWVLYRPFEAGQLPLLVAIIVGIALLAPLVVGCWLLRVGIDTRVGGGRVVLSLRPVWRIELRDADLEVQTTTVSPAQWGGVGLRRGFGVKRKTQRALLVGTGPALLLTDRSNGMRYTVQTRDPDALRAAITGRPVTA